MEHKDFKENISHGTLTFPLAGYKWLGEFEYTVNMHWHKEMEIIYFEKGTFQFCCDAIDYTVEAPALAFIDAGVMHSLALKKGQRESALVFDCRMLSYEWYDESQSTIIEPLIQQKLKMPQFILPKDIVWSEVITLYKKASREYEKGGATSNLRVKLYLTELLSLLYDNQYLTLIEDEEEPDSYQTENIKKAVSYIQENFYRKIRICEISYHIGMSEQYFCKYFKKMTGKTVTEYINEIRIEKASAKLINTDEKVIDIAIQCGYNNISYFIKRFSSAKGVTPQIYRKEGKKEK